MFCYFFTTLSQEYGSVDYFGVSTVTGRNAKLHYKKAI